MGSSQNGQETKKKRSGWIVVLIILLILLLFCCLVGGVLCWGSQRVPALLNWMYENAENYGFDEEEIEQLFQEFEQGDFDNFIPDGFDPLEELDPNAFEEEGELELDGGSATCQDLSGVLEVELLVGPADAVGLEPVTIGEIPFSVVSGGEIVGSTYLTYEGELEAEWGTYTVYFEGDVFLTGTCQDGSDGDILDLNVEFIGEQRVEVNVGGVVQEYPWSGSADVDISLPVQDGAREGGEGWSFVLRIE